MDKVGVARRQVAEDGLSGVLYCPAGQGKRLPAVIVLGGSDGGLQEGTAAVLAREGFAALALGYFGVDSLPADLVEIPLEYFEQAVGWLKAQALVDPERLGIIGASKSGELALLLAATHPEDIKAVVAYAPSSVVWQGMGWNPQESFGPPRSSWTIGSSPVPFVKLGFPEVSDFVELKACPLPFWPFVSFQPSLRYPVAREQYERAFRREYDVPSKSIAVEEINGPVLLVSGTDDQLWPSGRFAQMVVERLEAHNHPFAYEHLSYEGAGHPTGLPFSASVKAKQGPFVHGGSLGGSVEANGYMNADSWEKALALLHERFA